MNINNMINKEIDKRISNKKQANIGDYVRIGLTLLVIAAVTAALLAFVNSITEERIAQNERAVMEEALGNIFAGCDKVEAVEGEFDAPVTAVYAVYAKGELLGYGIQSSPIGFKDAIGLIVGADKSGKCIGVEITSITDTPGVGTKVKEDSFLGGFIDLDGSTVGGYDTISGATISSKAVKEGVAAALSLDIFEGAEGTQNNG